MCGRFNLCGRGVIVIEDKHSPHPFSDYGFNGSSGAQDGKPGLCLC